MYVTVLCRDPEVCSTIASSLRILGIPHSIDPSIDGELLQRGVSQSSPQGHLVLLHLASTPQDPAAIEQLVRLGRDQFRVVGLGRDLSSDRILEIIRAGAVDIVDLNHDLLNQLAHLLQRVQSTQSRNGPAPVLLPVIAPSGGCGATFIITNLACALAKLGHSVCLLDLKLCGGDLAAHLKLSPRHTFQSLAKRGNEIDAQMLEECLLRHESGVHLLASPEPFADIHHRDVSCLKRIIQTAGQKFSFVLYEIEGSLCHESPDLLKLGDRILIPLRMDFVSVYRAKRYLDFLRLAEVAEDGPLLVASRAGRPRDLLVQKVEEVLGQKVEHQIPEDAELANMSVNIGMPVTISHPQSALSQRIFQLARSLTSQAVPAGPPASHSRWWQPMRTLASYLGAYVT